MKVDYPSESPKVKVGDIVGGGLESARLVLAVFGHNAPGTRQLNHHDALYVYADGTLGICRADLLSVMNPVESLLLTGDFENVQISAEDRGKLIRYHLQNAGGTIMMKPRGRYRRHGEYT